MAKSKEHIGNKNDQKKKAKKTLQEKRAAKREKRNAANARGY